MIAAGLAGAFLVGTSLALWRLTPLHPAQLWLAPWTAAVCLYALGLLPYRDMDLLAAVVVGGSAMLVVTGSLIGDRFGSRLSGPLVSATPRRVVVERATMLLLALTAAGLLAFLVQVTLEWGVRSALVSSPDVRRTMGAGGYPLTIKYLYPLLGASILTGVCAGLAEGRRRRAWVVAAIATALAAYFSTGRSTVVLAGLIAATAFVLTSGVRLRPWRLVGAGALTGALAVAALILGGSLIGKTFANSELRTIDSVFTRTETLNALALPYQYASAPIAALNELVAVSPTVGGSDGCAIAVAVCTVAAGFGLPTKPEPAIRRFTASPLKWNTYTALDAPLLDGGIVAVGPVTFGLGIVLGLSWALACRRTLVGLVTYPMLATAALFSSIQFNFLASHIVGGMLFAALALSVATYVPGHTRLQ
jgi:hypothetical protein